jgi:hypothetical protein
LPSLAGVEGVEGVATKESLLENQPRGLQDRPQQVSTQDKTVKTKAATAVAAEQVVVVMQAAKAAAHLEATRAGMLVIMDPV